MRQSDNKQYERLTKKQYNAFVMGDSKYTKKMVEAKTMLKYWQGPSIAQPAPIANKEEEGGVDFVEQGKTAVVKKAPKGKFHRCVMVSDHFLSYCKVVSKESNKTIMSAKSQERIAKIKEWFK